MNSLIDGGLEYSTAWLLRGGAGIGPNPDGPPTSYGFNPPTLLQPWMQVYIEGPAYCDAMVAQQRPWVNPNLGLVTCAYSIVVDNTIANSQCIETEVRICDANGYNYNGSFQINNEEGGMIQIQTANQLWIDTGLKPGIYQPGVQYDIEIDYSFNVVAHTYSVLSYTRNGVVYTVPTNLQNVAAQLLNWAPGLAYQIQLDLNSKGGSQSIWLKNMRCIWPTK